MKKRKSIGLCVGICLLLLGILDVVNVFAAVTEGKAGETLTGEYAVIINTDILLEVYPFKVDTVYFLSLKN